MQFGQSDIQLGSPTFVAQTNVDRGVNTFEELQKILGMSAQVLTQAVELDTQEIRQKISYEAALEQQAERQSRQKAFKASERFGESDLERERLRKAGDLEGLQAFEERILQDKYTSPDEKAAAARAAASAAQDIRTVEAERERAKAERERANVDAVNAFAAKYVESLALADAANNQEDLTAIRNTLIDELAKTEDSDKRRVLVGLIDSAGQRSRSVEARSEEAQRDLEQAAAGRIGQIIGTSVGDITTNLIGDEGLLGALSASSGESIETAAFDYIREKLIENNPDIAAVIASGSEEEIKAVNRAIGSRVGEVSRAVMGHRDRANNQLRRDVFVDGMVRVAVADGPIQAFDIISERTDASPSDKERAATFVTKSYIEDTQDPVERVTRAQEIVSNPTSPRNAATLAARYIKENVDGIVKEFNIGRDSSFNPITETKVGWTRTFEDKTEFLASAAGRLGVDLNKVMANPGEYGPIAHALQSLEVQYDRDATASNRAELAMERRNRANNPKAKETLDADDIFDDTNLGMMLDDRQQISALTAEQAYMLIRSDATGYKDGRTPSRLIKKLTESWADPAYAELNRQFWKLNTVATNPVLMQSTDSGKYRQAMMAGIVYDHIISMPNMTDQAVQGMYTQAASILKAVQEPTLNLNSKDEGVIAATKSVAKAVDGIMTSGGIAVNGTWLRIDDVNYSGSELMGQMNPADQGTFLTFYLSAQALSSAVPGLDPSATTVQMMRSNGWVPYVNKDKGTASIVFSPPIQDPESGRFYQTVPSHEEMASYQFNGYMDGKKQRAVEWINSQRRSIDASVSVDQIKSIEPLINDLDAARSDGLGAVVKTIGGDTFYIPASAVNIGGLDWIKARGSADVSRNRPTNTTPRIASIPYYQ